MRELYKAKGYPQDWIDKRVRGIAVRDELTAEWENRGIADQKDFAINHYGDEVLKMYSIPADD